MVAVLTVSSFGFPASLFSVFSLLTSFFLSSDSPVLSFIKGFLSSTGDDSFFFSPESFFVSDFSSSFSFSSSFGFSGFSVFEISFFVSSVLVFSSSGGGVSFSVVGVTGLGVVVFADVSSD